MRFEHEHAPLAEWIKSSYSGSHGECVEVAEWDTAGAIRDTKHRGLGPLVFSSPEWHAFLAAVKGSGL